MRQKLLTALFGVLCLGILTFPAQAADWAAILADPDRPEADRVRDTNRKPDQVLPFFGIDTGQKVAEFLSGSGYYTRILVETVGEQGTVHAGNNPGYLKFFEEPWNALFATPAFQRVHRIDGPITQIALPQDGSLDAVIIVLAYHDLYLPAFSLTDEDRAKANARIFAALKLGGVYGIVDHHAKDGRGTSDAESLHRIEESVIINEITAAGFVLAKKGDVLRNLEDDHTKIVFDPSIRGKTDRFVLRFEKPAQ